jgi:hypothetical protein
MMKTSLHTVFLFLWLWMDCELEDLGQEKKMVDVRHLWAIYFIQFLLVVDKEI